MSQTIYKIKTTETLHYLLETVDKLVREIPVFELENLPNEDAARLCHEHMTAAAGENE